MLDTPTTVPLIPPHPLLRPPSPHSYDTTTFPSNFQHYHRSNDNDHPRTTQTILILERSPPIYSSEARRSRTRIISHNENLYRHVTRMHTRIFRLLRRK